jgi:predicted AlkP superfamily phosphohydrolase/phosphomutase
LNRLLYEQGYLVMKQGIRPGEVAFLSGVDWARTRAYALGLNSLFVNLRGREREGNVRPGRDYHQLLAALSRQLLDLRDEQNENANPIRTVVNVRERFSQAERRIAPDLIVGYDRNYRVGWEAPLGGIAAEPLANNLDAWSGDHCVSPELVPGILLCNRRIGVEHPSLIDISPTIVELCGIAPAHVMAGRSLIRGA